MTTLALPINLDKKEVAAFCKARGITRLRLFGSVVRSDYQPGISDVDVLADFAPGALEAAGWKSFLYAEEFASLAGVSDVDFLTPAELSQFHREQVLNEAVMVYEQS